MIRAIKWLAVCHPYHPVITIPGLLILAALALSGCMEATKRAAGIESVCTALVGPIRYNSQVRTSRRFAGPDLAPDLNKRNQIGRTLRCAQYR